MNKATQWLKDSGRDFSAGMAIYKEVFGMDKHYDFFSKAKNPQPGGLHFNILIEKVRVCERRIVNTTPEPETKSEAKAPDINIKPIKPVKGIRIVDNHTVEVSLLPKELQELFFRNKQIMKELAGSHGEMKSATDDAARAKSLELCKDLEQEKDNNWSAIDTWWNENKGELAGQLAGQKADKDQLETNIEKRIETVRKAIARVKKELKDSTLDLKKVASRKKKLATWEKEYSDLKAKKERF
jgi:hypothetical protein